MNYCIFKDIDSRELGLFMERCPEKISPKRRDEAFTVPGRNGNLTTTDGAFDSYIRSAEFIVKDEKRLDKICAHFKGLGWLIFSAWPHGPGALMLEQNLSLGHAAEESSKNYKSVCDSVKQKII